MTEYIITVDETKADLDGNVPISAKREVVRCRDCKHADWFAAVGVGTFKCKCHHWVSDKPDGFCAWGERRDA